MYNGMIINCSPVTANATPMREFDWCATIDGREEDQTLYGYGATKEEALSMLGEALVEHIDDRIHDLMTAGEISKEIADECFVSIDGLAWLPY
jgi:hypothetical protein